LFTKLQFDHKFDQDTTKFFGVAFLKEKKGGFKYEDLYECVFGVGIVPFYNSRVEERRGDLR